MPTALFQSYWPTYASSSLTIEWLAPQDTGCLAITSYTIQGSTDGSSWTDLALGILAQTTNGTEIGTASDAGSGLMVPG